MTNPLFLVQLFLTIISAYFVYKDSKGRDASPLAWTAAVFLIGIFLPPGLALSILAYLFLRPKGRLRRCPLCSRRVLEVLANCPHCRKAIKKDCYRCREAVSVDVEVCPYCGTRL
ncbi:MAG: hypothetical protein HYY08_02565 [Firmicutes bacterium]|nr:hypothetical protein [Bacillota bacterium]